MSTAAVMTAGPEAATPVRLRPALATLPAYAPGRNVPGAVKLASNEMSFPTLPVVAQAIAAAASDLYRYPDNGASALVEALAEDLGVSANRVVAGCGSVALCQQLVQIAADAGEEVLFNWRSFEAYPIVSQIAGARAVAVPNTPDHRLDLAGLAAAITPATRLIFVCTPNNPTGTAVTRAELEVLLDAVPEHVLVVVDEAYREFDTDPDSPDGVEIASQRPNVLSLRTMSKAYGLAGLRVGYAVGDPSVIGALRKVAIPFSVNALAQAAASAALAAREQLTPRWRKIIGERDRVTAGLRQAGYEVPTSQANFVWLPLRERATDFAAHCERNGVILRAFADVSGGVRITIGSPEENEKLLAAAATYSPEMRSSRSVTY